MSFSGLSKKQTQSSMHHSQFQNLEQGGQSGGFNDSPRQGQSSHYEQSSLKDSEGYLESSPNGTSKIILFILALAALAFGLFIFQRLQQISQKYDRYDQTFTNISEVRIREAEKNLEARLKAFKEELQSEMVSLKAIERQKLIKELKDQIRAQIKEGLKAAIKESKDQTRAQIKEGLNAAIKMQTTSLKEQMGSSIKESLRRDLLESLKQQITKNLQQEFKTSLQKRLSNALAQKQENSEDLPASAQDTKKEDKVASIAPKDQTSPITFLYPTVGIPEPGKAFNSTPVKPEELAIFDQTINDLFKPYNDTDCGMVKVGGVVGTEQGYLLCGNHLSQAQGLLNLGIQGSDEFGCQFSASFQVRNYLYDCKLQTAPACASSNNRQFYSICLGEITQSRDNITYQNLEDVLKNRNLQQKHIILKIDKPGYEFSTLKHFPLKMLDKIDQIIIQVHLGEPFSQVWGNLDIMKTLCSKFIPVNYHMNEDVCFELTPQKAQLRRIKSRAFQVTLVNKDILKLRSDARSYKKHPLYRVNRCSPKLECQMQN